MISLLNNNQLFKFYTAVQFLVRLQGLKIHTSLINVKNPSSLTSEVKVSLSNTTTTFDGCVNNKKKNHTKFNWGLLKEPVWADWLLSRTFGLQSGVSSCEVGFKKWLMWFRCVC